MGNYFRTLIVVLLSGGLCGAVMAQSGSEPGDLKGAADVATQAESAAPPAPAMAGDKQKAAPDVKTVRFDDWYLRCVTPAGATAQCEVFQIVQVKENDKDIQLLTIAFARAAAPEKTAAPAAARTDLVMTTIVPLNMFLPAGLTFFDGEKELKKLPYRNCNEAGCWTQSMVDESFVKGLSSAKDPAALMQLMSGKGINLKYSVKGLSAALVELRKQAK